MGHPRAKLWGQHPVHSGAAAGTDPPPTSPCQGPSTTTVNRLALLRAPHKQARAGLDPGATPSLRGMTAGAFIPVHK